MAMGQTGREIRALSFVAQTWGAAWGDIAHTNVAMKSKRAIKATGDAAKDGNNLCNSLMIKALAQEVEVGETKPSSTQRGLNTARSRK